MIWGFFENLYYNKLENREEFQDIYKISKLGQKLEAS